MRQRIFQKIGSLLGLLAILLATLAPTVSQTLAARHHQYVMRTMMPMPADAAMGDAGSHSMMSMHHSMMSMHGDPAMGDTTAGSMMSMHGDPTDNASSHTTMSHGDACGYCSLLLHLPALPSVKAAFALTVWAIQHREATRFESLHRSAPLTSAQPRAPPASS